MLILSVFSIVFMVSSYITWIEHIVFKRNDVKRSEQIVCLTLLVTSAVVVGYIIAYTQFKLLPESSGGIIKVFYEKINTNV